MGKKLTTEEFIKRSREVHGNLYDYSLVEYKGCKEKVKIICKVHDEFLQSPDGHINNKHGCPKCSGKQQTTIEFIKKAKEIHKDKYCYSMSNYINTDTKLTIICKVHGEFLQSPHHHISSKSGCPKCDGKYPTTEEFIKKAIEIHGDKYCYSMSNYKNSDTKLTIICKVHGKFKQSPHHHISSKSGCQKCLYKNEQECREILEKHYGLQFNKTWIKMHDSRFELDGYNPMLRIAFEYQGIQHYKHTKHFHRKQNALLKQQIRDSIKKRYCKKNGIKLLVIPYNLSKDEILKL